MATETELPVFKPKKTITGIFIPKKRKLVKTMILESLLDSVAALLRNCCGKRHPNKCGGDPEPPKPAADNNEKKIFSFQP